MFLPACILLWAIIWLKNLVLNPHVSQDRFLSGECVNIWVSKFCLKRNVLVQLSHLNVLSGVCIFRWERKFCFNLHLNEQKEHWYTDSSKCWALCEINLEIWSEVLSPKNGKPLDCNLRPFSHQRYQLKFGKNCLRCTSSANNVLC